MPKKLPENIEKAVQTIRKEYGHYVEAKLMRGRYRLFEATSIYDPEGKKPKKVTRYLGWLTEEGQLIPARHNDIKTKVINELDKSNEQRIKELEESLKDKEKKLFEESIRKKETEKHERDILRALSMNARITVPELSKITGLSNTAVNYHLRNLEKRYDIKYILEIDIEKFGYMNYIIFIKFKDKKPTYQEIKEQLEKIPDVQLAITTSGTYDIVIFMIAKMTSEARFTMYDLMRQILSSYNIEWIATPAFQSTFGFIPLRDQFFNALKEKVWARTKERPRPLPDEITEVEYNVIKVMNDDANADFTEIDRQINADRGRSNYAYHQLKKRGIIKRPTISINDVKSKSDVLFIITPVNFDKWAPSRKELLLDIIKEGKRKFDMYSFGVDIMVPRGVLLLTSIINDESIETRLDELYKRMKGVSIHALMVTSIPTGSINHRLFDKTVSSQYEILVSEYNYSPETILKETY